MKLLKPFLIVALVLTLTGCQDALGQERLEGVGLLIEDTINDQGWGTKGYKGLLQVKNRFDTTVFYREEIKSKQQVTEAVTEFEKDGVNLVFGHGKIYASIFQTIKADFPDIHFVSFNGKVSGDGITSIHFDSYAMGYFAGVLSGAMSQSGQVGMIAAFPWQPEVTGFREGVNVYNSEAEATIQFVENWSDTDKALSIMDEMEKIGVDVYYPAGDGYTIPVIKHVKNQGNYAIGFVSNMADLGKQTVLTSTVQHVDLLYVKIAKQFNNGTLESGNRHYDFQDEVISLAPFSDVVPKKLQKKLKQAVSTYKETGKLPAP
ncbi:BMP family ABC transporter substrate-binding protein [Alkalihalobacillus sp. AL-G]|uniref:BMP family ABC transporter substrate-binding protein n=1 Tax=Alkalihalobacillus sp. AL-G TaxID=2926399 RepID=UPI00272BDA11|nr:BMP family ABC transporter substrate-binding protein [Alkalihalobacillus sp. AL-G]WLD94902.1 BMP family ABC transporter substrate-binding protein [Alkalihalobacillus sp. AL-G]